MIPVLHHSTIVVADMERSLRFYRNVVGLCVVLDEELGDVAIARILGMKEVSLRIVLLKGGAQETGLVGLLSYISSGRFRPAEPSLGCFSHALVFTVDDIEDVYTKLLDAGEKPLSNPVRVTLPGIGTVRIVTCLDPNGVLVEFVQFTL